MKSKKTLTALVASFALVFTSSAVAYADSMDEDIQISDNVQIDSSLNANTPEEVQNLFKEEVPLDVTLDPETGEVIAVAPYSNNDATLRSVVVKKNSCNSGDVSLEPLTPYAFYCATGSGTKQGRWPYITAIETNNWVTQANWIFGGNFVNGPRLPKSTRAFFTGNKAAVTIVSLALSS